MSAPTPPAATDSAGGWGQSPPPPAADAGAGGWGASPAVPATAAASAGAGAGATAMMDGLGAGGAAPAGSGTGEGARDVGRAGAGAGSGARSGRMHRPKSVVIICVIGGVTRNLSQFLHQCPPAAVHTGSRSGSWRTPSRTPAASTSPRRASGKCVSVVVLLGQHDQWTHEWHHQPNPIQTPNPNPNSKSEIRPGARTGRSWRSCRRTTPCTRAWSFRTRRRASPRSCWR